jgi:pyridoxal phosphate enzyme (YggS family)
MSIAATVDSIRQKIEKINKNNALSSRHAVILGASKGQDTPCIEEAIAAGITHFGENRVQEAETKWPALKERFPSVQLHLIGPLQTNKVKQAVELFDAIQTIDRPKLAEALATEMHKTGKRLSCYIQVNIGKETQKAGVLPEETDALITYCKTQLQLPVVGLMCIPPNHQPPAPHFAMLREMALRNALPELSMGMSDDYETAVRMGSTCIRLGRILFGERSTPAE